MVFDGRLIEYEDILPDKGCIEMIFFRLLLLALLRISCKEIFCRNVKISYLICQCLPDLRNQMTFQDLFACFEKSC